MSLNLIEDLIGPLRMAGLATPMALQVAVILGLPDRLLGDSDQQVARVQHVRVEQHDETHSAIPIS